MIKTSLKPQVTGEWLENCCLLVCSLPSQAIFGEISWKIAYRQWEQINIVLSLHNFYQNIFTAGMQCNPFCLHFWSPILI